MDDERFPVEMLGDIAVLRLREPAPLDRLIGRVAATIEAVRGSGVRKLLVDALALEGVRAPDVGTRFFLAREWAVAAHGVVRIAVAVRAEFIDSKKFGVLVARNFGALADVFTSRAEALAWLQAGA